MSSSTPLPTEFEIYLKGALHILYQLGHNEQCAYDSLIKLTGEELMSEEAVKECFKMFKEGNYPINIRADNLKTVEDKGWISKMASWAFNGVSEYLRLKVLPPFLLKPVPKNEIVVEELAVLIGSDYMEVSVDGVKRRYEQSGQNCKVICGDSIITYENKEYLEEAAGFFHEFFDNPIMRIEKWIIRNERDFELNPTFEQTQLKCYRMLNKVLLSFNRYLRVERFQLYCYRIRHNMFFLPYLQPRFLRTIVIVNHLPEVKGEDELVFETPQFKSAECFACHAIDYDWYDICEKFTHFRHCQFQTHYCVNERMYCHFCIKAVRQGKLEKAIIDVGYDARHVDMPLDELFRRRETEDGEVRMWNDFGDHSTDFVIDVNVEKNRLYFMGPGYKGEFHTCYV
ncbi:unnamed protein product [Caenorhabditis brenneri]